MRPCPRPLGPPRCALPTGVRRSTIAPSLANDVANQWGTDYDESEDVLRVETTSNSGPQVEMMMFYFENIDETSGTAVLHWNETRVPFDIQVAGT